MVGPILTALMRFDEADGKRVLAHIVALLKCLRKRRSAILTLTEEA